jgi:hypothetical protein
VKENSRAALRERQMPNLIVPTTLYRAGNRVTASPYPQEAMLDKDKEKKPALEPRRLFEDVKEPGPMKVKRDTEVEKKTKKKAPVK